MKKSIVRMLTASAVLAACAVAAPSAGANYKHLDSWGNGSRIAEPAGVGANGTHNVFVSDSADGFLHGFSGTGSFLFSSYGNGPDPLGHTSGVAVPEAGPEEGNAYVVDSEKGRVVEFAPDGTVIRTFGTGTGTTLNQFNRPSGISVSPKPPYDVYIADELNNRIKEYTPQGGYVRRFGDPDPNAVNHTGELFLPVDVAVAKNGDIFVLNGSPRKVMRFCPDCGNGGPLYEESFKLHYKGEPSWTAERIAINHDGHIYANFVRGVARFSNSGRYLNSIAQTGFTGHSLTSVTDLDVGTNDDSDRLVFLMGHSRTPRIEVYTEHHPDTTVKRTTPRNQTTQKFKFTSTAGNPTYRCTVTFPGGYATALTQCSDPFESDFFTLDGHYEFDVTSLDKNKLRDYTPAHTEFTIDTTPPTTTIDSGPDGPTSDATPGWAFHSASDGDATFSCRIDGAAFAACTSPYMAATLGDGTHTFEVRAKDKAGNHDASPSKRHPVVVTHAPRTTLDGPTLTNDPTPEFVIESSLVGSTFECDIDGGGFSDCDSPFSPALDDGPHTVKARASLAGLTDATPASIGVTVDTVAPETTLTDQPDSPTTDRTPTYAFSSSDPAAKFECQRDDDDYLGCLSPHTTNTLGLGTHTFHVRAVDAAGNKDATPAEFTVKVVDN